MAVQLGVRVVGVRNVVETLERMSPKQNRAWVGDALKECGAEVQGLARRLYITRGGRSRGPRGPRGGRGKLTDAPADRRRITSRTGRLRDSIRVGLRRSSQEVSIGSDVVYARVHELGTGAAGIRISPKMRRLLHAKGITPRKTTRYVRIPKRPYLAPALRDASRRFQRIFIDAWERAL